MTDVKKGYAPHGFKILRLLDVIRMTPGCKLTSEQELALLDAVIFKIELLGDNFKGDCVVRVNSFADVSWATDEKPATAHSNFSFRAALDELTKLEQMIKSTNNLNHKRISSLCKQCVSILKPLGYKFLKEVPEEDQMHAGIAYIRTRILEASE